MDDEVIGFGVELRETGREASLSITRSKAAVVRFSYWLNAALHESEIGTELPSRDVRFHDESWGISGRAADIAKMARLTPSRHRGYRLIRSPRRRAKEAQAGWPSQASWPFSG